MIKTTTLYCREGSADKVYTATLNEAGTGLYTVDFSYGRRGSTMKPGTKTAKPVPLAEAEKIYNKLINEKLAKGYTEDTSGKIFVATNMEERFTGLLPQLLTAVDESRLEFLFDSPQHMMQEKFDGERRQIQVTKDGEILGINRKGLSVALPQRIEARIREMKHYFPLVLDGEQIGDVFYGFDIRQIAGKDYQLMGAQERYFILRGLLMLLGDPAGPIRPVETAFGSLQKKDLFEAVRARNGEGVVFKEKDAHYTHGRSTTQLKYKFTERATVKVWGINAQRSVKISMRDNGSWKPVGKVTIPPNFTIPSEDDLVEVRYLYAYPDGSLYQPVYLGERPDKDNADEYNSLKFKAGTEEDDA